MTARQAMSFQKNRGAVRRFAMAMRFGAWLQSLPLRLTPPPFRLMQIGSAFWQSRALYVAATLDIATRLGDDTLQADVIADRVRAHPDATARLLRLLAAMGIFEETAPATYRNNQVSAFLRTDNARSVRAMILMHNADAMSRPWFEQLERGVREGVPPFRLTHGAELFEYLDDHPDLDALFSEAMTAVEALAGDSFTTDFDWGRFQRIIDMGGSRGAKSLAIVKHYPQLTALVVDRPQVIAQAQRWWAEHPVASAERLRFEAGDLLAKVPPSRGEGDIYLLAAVLHGFDDATAVTALVNLADACRGTGARIALLELVLPERHADLAGASFDMQMFMATRGRERTLAQWKSLFERSHLHLEEVVALRSFGSVLVLRPAA